jgi:hypothetical protein
MAFETGRWKGPFIGSLEKPPYAVILYRTYARVHFGTEVPARAVLHRTGIPLKTARNPNTPGNPLLGKDFQHLAGHGLGAELLKNSFPAGLTESAGSRGVGQQALDSFSQGMRVARGAEDAPAGGRN